MAGDRDLLTGRVQDALALWRDPSNLKRLSADAERGVIAHKKHDRGTQVPPEKAG